MSNTERDKILLRVKKMMTLANDAAATEGERDNALRMAHATLAKYNLSMAEAEAAGTIKEEQRIKGEMEITEHPWMRTVAMSVAKLFFCHMFRIKGRNYNAKYCFIGKISNAETAMSMTAYVIESINREARRKAKEMTGNPSGTYWRSFCKGAAYKIHLRCDEIRAAATPAAATGTSLVLASLYQQEHKANQLFIVNNLGISLRTTKSRQRSATADAFAAGSEYGSGISLNNQLGNNKSVARKRLT